MVIFGLLVCLLGIAVGSRAVVIVGAACVFLGILAT